MSLLPETKRGRRTAAQEEKHREQLQQFSGLILEISSTLDFKIGSRGWCYVLEQHGLDKGEFARAESLIGDCRKAGLLPLDICADDDARAASNLHQARALTERPNLAEYVRNELDYIDSVRDEAIESAGQDWTPWTFWERQDCYIEMLVEKIDLKELFKNTCSQFNIPIGNSRGWPDINSRAAMMQRFSYWESQGKQVVLLYCGDHDPAGLGISQSLRKMFDDLSGAVGWRPNDLVIDRFGLNADFIDAHGLSWIQGLETSSGKRLDHPGHKDHKKDYVQQYIQKFGPQKCEANSLVTQPAAGRKLCLDAICNYLPESAPKLFQERLAAERKDVHDLILDKVGDYQ